LPARFDGKVALVIGGSSGIGLATVRGLLAEGGRVVLAARDAARLAAVGQELLGAHQGRVAWVNGDISELGEEEVCRGDRDALRPARYPGDQLGLQLYAGHRGHDRGRDRRGDPDTNARGPLLAARAASRAFGPEGGRIVTLSATAARRGRPHRSVYAATKGAVEAMARVLAVELAPRKITVNCVAPGLTDTPMLGGDRDDPNRTRQVPMGRLGRPEEVATVVLFLASDDAGWVTGQTVDATGGYGL